MNEGERSFEQITPPTRESVISALSNIRTVEDSQAAAKLLGRYLDTLDTSKMKRLDRMILAGTKTHCKKPDAEIDDGDRYVKILEKYPEDENK